MKRVVACLILLYFISITSVWCQENEIEFIFFEDFETWSTNDLKNENLQRIWPVTIDNNYDENYQSIIDVQGERGKVWNSLIPEGHAAGCSYGDAGCVFNIHLDTSYSEVWFSSYLWANPEWDVQQSPNPIAAKILFGMGGGNDRLDDYPWTLDTSSYFMPNPNDNRNSNGWIAHGLAGSGPDMKGYIYDQYKTGPESQIIMDNDYDDVPRGYWVHITRRIKMNDPGQRNGIFEIYIDGKLLGQQTDLMFASWEQAQCRDAWFINYLAIIYFFGGSGCDYASPHDNIIRFDNLCAFYPNPNASFYLEGPAPEGYTIPIIDSRPEGVLSINPHDLVYDEIRTEANGIIKSHYAGNVFVPYGVTVEKKIIRNEMPITLNFDYIKDEVYFDDGWSSDKEMYLDVYSSKGELLHHFYNGNNPMGKGDFVINDSILTLRYYSGENHSRGFGLIYSSPGENYVRSPEENNETCDNNPISPKETFFAEEYSFIYGAKIQTIGNNLTIGYLDEDKYVGYCNVDFSEPVNKLMLNMVVHPEHTGEIEVRIDSSDGSLIGTIETTSTGDWSTFGMQEADIKSVTGIHNLYFVSKVMAAGNIDWFRFSKNETSSSTNQAPIIEDQNFNVIQSDDISSFIGNIVAHDNDSEQELSYHILSGNNENLFTLDQNTGNLYFNTLELDFHYNTHYELVVEVMDNAAISLNDIANITIDLITTDEIVYIDPEIANEAYQDGSKEHPYSSWSKVTWNEESYYYQKRGTTSTENKILITANNVTLGAYGSGDHPKINSKSTDYALRAYDKSEIVVRGLHITANDALSCISFLGETYNIVIENCILDGAICGLRFIDGDKYTIKYNVFNNIENGIFSYASATEIQYNIFKGNGKAINIMSSNSNAKIYNNVFYNNQEGISASYGALSLYNNIFYLTGSSYSALNIEFDEILSDNNIFYPEKTGFIMIDGKSFDDLNSFQEAHNIDLNSFSAEPLFVDIYNDNFELQKESPAVDAGKFLSLACDFSGCKVPVGGAPDIGSYELSNSSESLTNLFGINTSYFDQISISPNPSDGRFQIISNDKSKIQKIEVVDITGKKILNKNYNNPIYPKFNEIIDISNFPNGVYVLVVSCLDEIISKKIIIQ